MCVMCQQDQAGESILYVAVNADADLQNYTTQLSTPRGSCKCVRSAALLRLSWSSSCPRKLDELSAFKRRVS